jgi:hypothetical protein
MEIDEPETLDDVTTWLARIFFAVVAVGVLLLLALVTR